MQLVYLSPTPWGSFSQRPHELVRQFHAKTGKPILWVEPYPTRFPVFKDISSRPRRPAEPGPEIPPWLTVIKPLALPIEPLPCSGWLNRMLWYSVIACVRRFAVEPTLLGIGKPSALGLQLLREPIFAGSFYDAMDNFSEFYEGWSRYSMARRQIKTAQSVTTILTSSSALETQFSTQIDVRLLRNACASERMPALPTAPTPRDRRAPVFGYVGTIAKWFDWDFVIALATVFPHAEIRLIGPVHVDIPASLPANIRLLATLSHSDAVSAMALFDVGLIPFKLSEVTRFVDPIKYYEYRALGLPVVSSVFGEMADRRGVAGVFLIDGPADIPLAFEQALAFGESLESTAQFRHANSWEARFEDVHAIICDVPTDSDGTTTESPRF